MISFKGKRDLVDDSDIMIAAVQNTISIPLKQSQEPLIIQITSKIDVSFTISTSRTPWRYELINEPE